MPLTSRFTVRHVYRDVPSGHAVVESMVGHHYRITNDNASNGDDIGTLERGHQLQVVDATHTHDNSMVARNVKATSWHIINDRYSTSQR